jgi:ubiquinone/menaquinone biosynthesis C-methylase UbiE
MRDALEVCVDHFIHEQNLAQRNVGCGCAATTVALAQKVGLTGHVFGIDIPASRLDQARQIAPKGLAVDFVLDRDRAWLVKPRLCRLGLK